MSTTIPELDYAATVLTYDYDELELQGEITYLGGAGATVTKRGFLYLEGTTGTPTYATNDGKVEETSGGFSTGAFSLTQTGLSPNTAYRVCAFAENQEGYGYSPVSTFYTNKIVTDPTWNKEDRTNSGGELSASAESGITITKRGFVWLNGASGDPTYASNDGYVEDTGTLSTGIFSKTITSMAASSSFRVRAFTYSATYGYQYSNTVDYTTLASGVFCSLKAAGTASNLDSYYDPWVNPSNVLTDNTSYAQAGSDASSEPSDLLVCTNFGFSLPEGSVIEGVEVYVRGYAYQNVGTLDDYVMQLYGFTGVGNNQSKVYDFDESVATEYVWGGESNNWGATGLTRANVNDSNFGFKFSVYWPGSSATPFPYFRVEYVEMLVYYSIPAKILTGVASECSVTANSGTLLAGTGRLFTGVASESSVTSVTGTLIANQDRQFAGVTSESSVTSESGTLLANQTRQFEGVASECSVTAQSGSLLAGTGKLFEGVASICDVTAQLGTVIAVSEQVFTSVPSECSVTAESGSIGTGYIFTGVASECSVTANAGTLVAYIGQILDGVSSESAVTAVAGTLAAYTGQPFIGIASLSDVTSVAGTLVSNQNRVLTGVASESAVSSVPGTLSSGMVFSGAISLADVTSVAGTLTALQTILSQYGFRFRNDNGTDVTATWRASQNSNIALSGEDSFRIRFGINGNDDPSITPQLEYRLKKSGGAFGDWKKVTNGN